MLPALRAFAVVLFCLGFAACGDDRPEETSGTKAGRKTGPATQTVEIRGSRYVPETVTIRVGESVKWVNRDDIKLRHSATRTLDPKFDTGSLTKDDESEPITFTLESDATGWQYGCTTPGHRDMKGFVVVTKP
jgi:plastocyanin